MVLFLHIQPVNETDGVDTFSQREMRPIGCSTAPAPRPVTRWNEMSATINRSEIVLELFDAYYERVFAFARKSAGPRWRMRESKQRCFSTAALMAETDIQRAVSEEPTAPL